MRATSLLLMAASASYGVCQTSTLPFDPAVASAYACPSACQSYLASGVREDDATFTPSPIRDASFYDTAANFTHAKPGDLLKLERIQNLTSYDFSNAIPGGTTLYAIQYASVGLNNTRVPATGFVALPFSLRDSASSNHSGSHARFPLVSFSHGTSGVLPNCAPSSSSNFYDYFTWTPMVLAGFAVVATDYSGLGNNYTRHPYVASRINSNDVFYAAQAAQKAFPDLVTERWGAVGHSQGGGSVYALTENELVHSDERFVGAVAISPAVRIYDQLKFSGVGMAGAPPPPQSALGYLTLHTWAMQTAFPATNFTAFLSHTFARRYALAERLGLCLAGASSLTGDLQQAQLFAPDGGEDRWFAELKHFQDAFGAGTGRKSYAPLLVVQALGDTSVPYKASLLAYNASCAAGNDVELVLVPLLDHSATVGATTGTWLPWLGSRILANETSMLQKCSLTHQGAVDMLAAYAPLNSQGY